MKFTVIRNGKDPLRDTVANATIESCLHHGNELVEDTNGVRFVFNLTDTEAPRAYRRRSQNVFVVSFISRQHRNGNLQSFCYTALVRTLSNLVICAVPENGADLSHLSGGATVYFTTPEAGFYQLSFDPEAIYQRVLPIVGSHFATENIFTEDLPPRHWRSSPIVEKIKEYGKELDSLGVLPAPFPLHEILSAEDLRHIYKIYGITGASYGNLSARECISELGETTFWMTGRGVNKANLSRIGKDVLLVKGFDYEQGAALVSVPPDFDPKARVSVDAVEHHLIYKSFPEVGAIVHVHAWMEGVLCTHQYYPCGTRELAEEVVDLLAQTDDPCRTAVGLKNHGLTITGPTLDEIFERIRGRLQREVAMFA